LTPSHEECKTALLEAERVVRQTIPASYDAPRYRSAEGRS